MKTNLFQGRGQRRRLQSGKRATCIAGALFLIISGLFTACPVDDDDPVARARTATPTTETASQVSTVFTLSNDPAYPVGTTWKVYNSETGGTVVDDIIAAYDRETKKLTLSSSTGGTVTAADYYVSATEPGKTESLRLKLTVTGSIGPVSTATPATGQAAVAKTGDPQASVVFTLTNSPAYPAGTEWKVYAASTGDTLAEGVSATYASGTNTLTLTHESDIPAADYFVSAKETGKTESQRLAVTVAAYVADLPTATPATGTAELTKTAAVQASVEFILTNAYADGTEWKVYAASTGEALAAGVSATYASGANTLTLTHGTDIPAGVYYVSATEPDKSESQRLALTVYNQPVSATPTATVTTVAKAASVQKSVVFTLTSTHTGGWKVYEEETGGSPLAAVSASFNTGTNELTLTATGDDLADDAYFVSVTEDGKQESARLELLVEEYLDPNTTAKPVAANAAARTKYKTGASAQSVEYTLTNTYAEGVQFTVYDSTGAALAADVTAQWESSGKKLTLSHTASLPAGMYQITATEPDKMESAKQHFTVKGWGTAAITITAPAIPGEPASISGNTSVSKAAGTLTITVAGEGITVQNWLLDGAVVTGTGDSIAIDLSGLSVGLHRVTVIIQQGSVPYSQELAFTLTE
jgi:hypothetical protein